MRPEEADLVGQWIDGLALPPGSVCLNIGSSTEEFRRTMQPHVGALFDRIEAGGLRVVHCDMKAAAGVHEVGDVFDPAFQERLRDYHADLLLCSNLLEHLTDPAAFARACGSLVKPGGYGLFTVPYDYPYHPDPIDTMFRPSPAELVKLLPGWQITRGEIIEAGRYKARGLALIKHVGRVVLPFYRPHAWRPLAHKLLWLFKPFRQTLLLARKPA